MELACRRLGYILRVNEGGTRNDNKKKEYTLISTKIRRLNSDMERGRKHK